MSGAGTCAVWTASRPLTLAVEKLIKATGVTQEDDARMAALDALERVSEKSNDYKDWKANLAEIRAALDLSNNHKGLVVVLYCSSAPKSCEAFMAKVQAELDRRVHKKRCFFLMNVRPKAFHLDMTAVHFVLVQWQWA